ncbi:MAG TPA: DUF929 family protein [Acidimicrobiales bacterium]|nr:DUF929 family protein [Acidimicrobiales bacterium]
MAFGAVGSVVVVVVVLVVVKVAASSAPAAAAAPVERPLAAAVGRALTTTPLSVADAVGTPSSVTAPVLDASQPELEQGGKPAALYIGGEFCPNCAAERWPIVMAFSRFGTFHGLTQTTSSPWEGSPIATLSFRHATYSSGLIAFDPVEQEGNDTHGAGTHGVIHRLTASQRAVWATFADRYTGGAEGYPFLTIGNRVLVMGRSYDGAALTGLSAARIAAQLSDPASPVTQGIVGTATYLTAGICALTGGRPAPVCSAPAVTAARRALGLH